MDKNLNINNILNNESIQKVHSGKVGLLPSFFHFDFVVVQLAKIKTDSSFHMGASELIN